MRTGKLIAVALLLSLALWSCGSEPKEKPEGEPMASGEIVNRYVNRLTTAPQKARDAGEAVEDRTKRLNEAIGD